MHFVILLFLGIVALLVYFLNQSHQVKHIMATSLNLNRIFIYLVGGILFGFLFTAFSSNYRIGVIVGIIVTYTVYNVVRHQKNKY